MKPVSDAVLNATESVCHLLWTEAMGYINIICMRRLGCTSKKPSESECIILHEEIIYVFYIIIAISYLCANMPIL